MKAEDLSRILQIKCEVQDIGKENFKKRSELNKFNIKMLKNVSLLNSESFLTESSRSLLVASDILFTDSPGMYLSLPSNSQSFASASQMQIMLAHKTISPHHLFWELNLGST